MRTIAIGDIQGCYRTLKRLLERINFKPDTDRVLLVGDLVNRGPDSLSVLRWAKNLGPEHAITVLGNHDLYLLSTYLGVKTAKKNQKDTIGPVLEAPDCDELMAWLRQQPLLYKDGKTLLVHAGILPAWNVKEALTQAALAERYLQGDKAQQFLEFWNSYPGHTWKNSLGKMEKAAVALNVFTRMRTCSSAKTMDFEYSGKPKEAPRGLIPWYKYPERAIKKYQIIFGHWAALGYKRGSDYIAMDSGCVWGGSLTAYNLDDRKKTSVRSVEKQ